MIIVRRLRRHVFLRQFSKNITDLHIFRTSREKELSSRISVGRPVFIVKSYFSIYMKASFEVDLFFILSMHI